MSENLGLETVKSIGEGVKVRLGTPFDPSDAGLVLVWHEALTRAGMTDDNAKAIVVGFADAWTKDKLPRLSHLCRYAKRHRPRSAHIAERAEVKCKTCDDTGRFRIVLPVSSKGGLTAMEDGFHPGVPWGASRVYHAAVPCLCEIGQGVEKNEPLSDSWQRRRMEFLRWFDEPGLDPASKLNQFERACCQAFEVQQKEDVRQWREQQATMAALADVPEDEIPF